MNKAVRSKNSMQITIILLAIVIVALQVADVYTTILYSQFRTDQPNWVWIVISKLAVIGIVVALFLLTDENELLIIYVMCLGVLAYTYVVLRNWHVYTLFKGHRDRNL